VDELLAEGHRELLQLRRPVWPPEPRDGDEEVEDLRTVAPGVQPRGVATSEDPCHDGFGHARSEGRRDGGVGGTAAFFEDLQACLGGRRVARRNAGGHGHLC
jgi:hypothetical protein